MKRRMDESPLTVHLVVLLLLDHHSGRGLKSHSGCVGKSRKDNRRSVIWLRHLHRSRLKESEHSRGALNGSGLSRCKGSNCEICTCLPARLSAYLPIHLLPIHPHDDYAATAPTRSNRLPRYPAASRSRNSRAPHASYYFRRRSYHRRRRHRRCHRCHPSSRGYGDSPSFPPGGLHPMRRLYARPRPPCVPASSSWDSPSLNRQNGRFRPR